MKERKPYVVHIDKSATSIYAGLIERRKEQKINLDTSNPNFGCWDRDVTAEFYDGFYRDISESQAIENIQKLLDITNPKYIEYRDVKFDSDILKNNPTIQQELQDLIVTKLKSELC